MGAYDFVSGILQTDAYTPLKSLELKNSAPQPNKTSLPFKKASSNKAACLCSPPCQYLLEQQRC